VDPDAEVVEGIHPALAAWGRVIEKFLAKYPEQWLRLDRAFVEDTTAAAGAL